VSDQELAQQKEQPAPAVAPQKNKSGLAWLALLVSIIAIVIAGAGGWLQWQQQQTGGSKQLLIDNDIRSLRNQLNNISQRDQQSSVDRQIMADQFSALVQIQQTHAKQLTELALVERDDWKLAEVEYLLRLAHQRIVLSRDAGGAKQLLQTADDILFALGYSDLYAVRKQLAQDIAAVSSAANTDNEGVYLQLLALAELGSTVPFSGYKELADVDAALSPTGEGMQDKILGKLAYAWHILKQLVVVKDRTVDIEPLLSENQRQLVDARLKLSLAQARSALLLNQASIYQASLAQAEHLLTKYYQAGTSQQQRLLAQIAQLASLEISPVLPDISASQRAIKEYVNARLVQKNSLDNVPTTQPEQMQ
jgi:uroporphyrin-3 C-methyltransferase